MRVLILLCAVYLSCISTSCMSGLKSLNNYDLNYYDLEIKQVIYGNPNEYTYILRNNMIFIMESLYNRKKLFETKHIYSRRVNRQSILDDISRKIYTLHDLDSNYIQSSLGGIRWEIKLLHNENVKYIMIENKSVKEIKELFMLINTLVPKKIPHLDMH